MIEARDREINGTHYTVRMLNGTKGKALLTRLFKLAGPALADILAGIKDAQSVQEMKLDGVADAVRSFASRLPDNELNEITLILAEHTEITIAGGKPMALKQLADSHFAGNYREMFSWIAFALEVNYADFFGGSDGLQSAFSALRAKAQSRFSSQQPPIGSSTASQPATDTSPA